MNNHEDKEQSALFQWRDQFVEKEPLLALLFHIPNGGHRHVSVAMRLKRQGVKKGVWDLNLPVPSGFNHGLWIEMKAGKNKLTPEQVDFGAWMTATHHKCVTAWTWTAAALHICRYLRLDPYEFGLAGYAGYEDDEHWQAEIFRIPEHWLNADPNRRLVYEQMAQKLATLNQD